MLAYLLGAVAATATPTVAPPPAPPKTVIIAPTPKREVPDLAMMMKMFDTIFPPQPAPDPARLPLAHATALALLPPDALGKETAKMMGGLYERVMGLRGSDIPGMTAADLKGASPDQTLRQTLVAKDPYFDERARLTRAAVEVELMKFAGVIEPRMRDGIARAVARRFDQKQLTDINAFFATDSGRALSRNFLGLWFHPELMRSTVTAMPDMIQLMPGAMERIAAATKHLPPPPRPKVPAAKTPARPKPAKS